jgi:hypothetical protein
MASTYRRPSGSVAGQQGASVTDRAILITAKPVIGVDRLCWQVPVIATPEFGGMNGAPCRVDR